MSQPACRLEASEQAALRPPQQVMRLSRMGSFFPTRLSFMRVMLRRLAACDAGPHGASGKIAISRWAMDDDGFGHAVLTVRLDEMPLSLIAYSNRLADEDRTDRVIATAWDAAFVLYDGIPDDTAIQRLMHEVPHQEAGRYTQAELVLSRANKSVRLFEAVVSALAKGRQPDAGLIASTGYLMRTTAVYGNGKFGISDRGRIADRPALAGPFAAEMLTVYLIRHFTHLLVEHIAAARGGNSAVRLDLQLKRHLGIGNSTGLGMAPFLVMHPVLLNNWMLARETAWARVRGLAQATPQQQQQLRRLLRRSQGHLLEWQVPDAAAQQRIDVLRQDWQAISLQITDTMLDGPYPFAAMATVAEGVSEEAEELMLALCLEVNGQLIDGLAGCMDASGEGRINPAASVSSLAMLIEEKFSWATAICFDDPARAHHFWYVSEAKLEPRYGERFNEPGAERESPLDIARRIQALAHSLASWSRQGGNAVSDSDGKTAEATVAEFLLRHPEHRLAVRRVQTNAWAPYSEICDNLIDQDCLPVDMLRCKLSFFGAAKFDPKSDRWTRITLYQGAPLADELDDPEFADDWWLPVLDLHQGESQNAITSG